MGASSGSEGHPEKLPEPLCFGSGSLEIARLCSRLLHSARVGKEQSVSARRIKETKLLTLCTLRTLPPKCFKAEHPANKDRNETPTGATQLGKEEFPATELPEVGHCFPRYIRLPPKERAASRSQLYRYCTPSTWQGPGVEQGHGARLGMPGDVAFPYVKAAPTPALHPF